MYNTDGETLFRWAQHNNVPAWAQARAGKPTGAVSERARGSRNQACEPRERTAHVHRLRPRTSPAPYRQDAYMHYLFGVMEDGAWGAIDTRDVSKRAAAMLMRRGCMQRHAMSQPVHVPLVKPAGRTTCEPLLHTSTTACAWCRSPAGHVHAVHAAAAGGLRRVDGRAAQARWAA